MDVKKARELTKIINICKKMGVVELKFEGIELKLSPLAIKEPRVKKYQDTKDPTPTPDYSEDETLFWSTPGISEQPEA